MSADSLAKNTPNVPKRFSPICLPKPKSQRYSAVLVCTCRFFFLPLLSQQPKSFSSQIFSIYLYIMQFVGGHYAHQLFALLLLFVKKSEFVLKKIRHKLHIFGGARYLCIKYLSSVQSRQDTKYKPSIGRYDLSSAFLTLIHSST